MVRIQMDWHACGRSCGIELDPCIVGDCSDFQPFNDYQRGILSTERYVQLLSEFLSTNQRQAAEIHNRILVEPYPGIDELASDLKSVGFRTGCLSNTNELHWQQMMSHEVFPTIAGVDFPLASHEHGLEKPDSKFYTLLEVASGVKGDDIAFFDDLEPNVAAARQVGWRSEQIDPLNNPAAQIRRHLMSWGWL